MLLKSVISTTAAFRRGKKGFTELKKYTILIVIVAAIVLGFFLPSRQKPVPKPEQDASGCGLIHEVKNHSSGCANTLADR